MTENGTFGPECRSSFSFRSLTGGKVLSFKFNCAGAYHSSSLPLSVAICAVTRVKAAKRSLALLP